MIQKNKSVFFFDFDGTIIPFLKFENFKNVTEFKKTMSITRSRKEFNKLYNRLKRFNNKEIIILTAKGKYDCPPAINNLKYNKINYKKFIYCGGLQFNKRVKYNYNSDIIASMKIYEILKYIIKNNININNIYYIDEDQKLLDKMKKINDQIKYIKL